MDSAIAEIRVDAFLDARARGGCVRRASRGADSRARGGGRGCVRDAARAAVGRWRAMGGGEGGVDAFAGSNARD